MANSFAATVTSSRVLAVQGEAWVTDANGERRTLTANDQIALGEWVATAPGAVLMLAMGEAAVVTLGQEEKLRFDKAFLAELDKQAEDGSLQDAVNFEAIEQALTEGRSLDEILPAAAAGDGPLSSNNSAGTGGVRVDLTAERVTPQSGFETSTTGYDSNRQFNDIGGRDSDGLATAAQPTALSINPLAVDDIINAEEQNQPLILSGNATNAPDGALVTVSFNGNQYLAQVSNGQWTATVPAADLQAAADGPYTLTANAGTAEVSRSFAIDTQANAAINFTSTVTADNELSLAEANGTVTLTGNVTGDFSAGDLVTLTVNGVNYTGPLAADGSFSIDVAGSDLQADSDSAVTASFIATDAAGNTQTVTNQLAYQVEAPNLPGTATIAGTAAEDEVLTAQLTDPDGVASVQGYQWFANGLPIAGATAETYQLTDADVGTQITVAISYTDARGETATVTSAATSAVSPVNDNPVANDDAALTTNEDTPVTSIDVLSNDTDVDGDTLTVTAASAVNGTVTINTDGTLNYTPNPNYSGTDTISYTISDGNGGSDSASVTVNITPVNDAPTTSPVTLSAIAEDSGARIITQAELLANASDVDGDSLTAENLAIASGNGTLVANGDGTWTYTPASNDDTAVSFSYDITDGTETINSGSASLDLTPVNDAPVLDLDGNNSSGATGADFQTSFTEGGSAVRIADTDVVISDVDNTTLTSARIQIGNVESGDLLTVGALPAGITASAYNPSTGVLTLSGSGSLASYQQAIRAVQFSNDGSASGADKDIQISVFDGQGWSNTAHTTVTMVLIPTVSVADVSVQEPQSGTTTLTFTINIDTPPSSDLTFTYQTASGSATGGDDYVQVGPLVGTIAAGATSTTVSITVNSDSNVFEGDESFTLNLSGFNQTVNFAPGSHLTANGVQAIGTIGANNGAPVAEDDVFITSQDQVLTTGNVLANDTLVDGAAVGSFDAVTTNGGSVVYNNDGTFTYTPSASFIGTDTFTYTLIDADGETDTATVTIEVADTVVQPPQISGLADINYIENAAATALFSGVGITDLDSANLSSVVVTIEGFLASQDVIEYLTAGTNVTAVVNQTGTTWQVTLSGGADIGEYITVLESITYQNSSENPSASTRSVTLEAFDQEYANIYGSDTLALSVTPVNDAPTVFDNNRFVVEGTVGAPMNIQAPTDVDSDDAELLITVTGIPEVATGVVSYADGITNPVSVGDVLTLSQLTSLLFHASGAESIDSFTYTVFDGELTTTGTTTLTVGATQPDFNTVYESGLPGGSGVTGQSATAEGNLFSNDGSGGGTITSIEFGGTAYTASGGVITVDTPLGLLTVDAATGDYTYQLTNANATGADVDEQFTYNFVNGAPLSDTLTITIVDDVPIASNVSQTIPESEENTFNLMFSLDISTSMNASVGTSGDTRLSLAKQSLVSLAEEYFNQSTKVSLTVLLFANGAHRLGTYTDFESAKAAIESVTDVNQTSYSNDLGGSGSLTNSTSYVDALSMIRNEFAADLLGQNAADNVQNISYFLSDGAVTADGSPVGMGYKEFVNNNGIKSYSVGIGDGLPSDLTDLNYAHNIDSLGRGHGTVDPALIVSDVSLLQSELLSTVPTAFGGNITQEGTITRVSMGADGGHVASIVILLGDPAVEHTISYDGANFTVSPALPVGLEVEGTKVTLNSDDGFAYGTFTMDFATGSYLFIAPNGTAEVNFQFDYTVLDGDGDSATATAKFNIVDDKPDARDDLHTGGYLDKIQGNVITGLGTDGGPALGAGFTPFAAQGGGVDKIVDAAKVTAFNYRGVDFDLGIQINDVGVAEVVQLTTASALANSQFLITSPNGSLTFNADGLGVGDGEIDVGESVTIDFRTPELMYGVNDLVLSLRDFGNNNFARADVYDINGSFLGQVSVRGDVPGDQLDLTAFENVGYVQLQPTSGGENDLTLYEVSYSPALIPNLDGSTGSLSYEYHIETSLSGDYVLEVKINDSSDGSEFVMRSNGFYEYLSPGANSLTPVDVDTTSAANVSASDITLNASSGVGYGSVGAHVQGGFSDGAGGRIQEGETLHVDFNGGAMPNGATDIVLSLGSYVSGEAVYITVYGVGNQVLLNNQLFDSAKIDLSDYVGVTRVSITGAPTNAGPGDLDSGRPTYVGLVGVHYAAVPAAVPTAINPELINYTLTDADGQMDTAQLALYTIDNRIAGTSNNDNIIGSNLNDAITGGAGNDILSGGAGHDSISGGDGADIISGGSGNDYLAGGAGNDELYGNEGDDHLAGDAGDDLMDGGIGADILIGGDGDDRLFGGADNDKLYGGQGNDALYGGSGDDLLVGEAGDDLLNGGSGNDVLYGGEDQDTLIGGEGDDILFGGRGDDTLTGGNGADTFAWARGTIGTDTVTDFNTADGDKLDLSDLLVGEESGDIENYLQFNFSNGDTYISIDADAGGSFEVGQVIVLQGVDLTMGNTLTAQQIVDDLISGGNLTLDS